MFDDCLVAIEKLDGPLFTIKRGQAVGQAQFVVTLHVMGDTGLARLLNSSTLQLIQRVGETTQMVLVGHSVEMIKKAC